MDITPYRQDTKYEAVLNALKQANRTRHWDRGINKIHTIRYLKGKNHYIKKTLSL